MKRTSKLTKEMTLNSKIALNLTGEESIAIYTEVMNNPFPLNEIPITKKDIATLKKIATELKKFKNYRHNFSTKLYDLTHELNINILFAKITDLLPNRTDVTFPDWRNTPLLDECITTKDDMERNFPCFYMDEIIETLKNN
jgi:hypothetical protein